MNNLTLNNNSNEQNPNLNVDNIQLQLNYIKRKLNERAALSNLSSYANIAQTLTNGTVKIEIDSVNKIISFLNGTKKSWINAEDQTLNNFSALKFKNKTQLNGLVDLPTFKNLNYTDIPSTLTNHTVSVDVVADVVNDVHTNFAPKDHKHPISDVNNLQTELDGKASMRRASCSAVRRFTTVHS